MPEQTATPHNVRFEHHADGRLGIGETRPRLSWEVSNAQPGFVQASAEVSIVINGPRGSERSVHRLDGAGQVLVPWPGRELRSRERVTVQARVSDGSGWGPLSDPATVELGLVDPGDWSASFVGLPWQEHSESDRRPGRLRATFSVTGNVARARLYLSAHGLAQAEINGRRAGDEEFTPGWTSYEDRLRYATFDVTDLLVEGDNAIGIWMADGWWRGHIGFDGGLRNFYGSDQSALAQLEYETTDGIRRIVPTNDTWTAGFGPILFTGLYEGESYDARLDDPSWSMPTGDVTGEWTPVSVQANTSVPLIAPSGPPVRCAEELSPITAERRDGRWILDFGQNHSGRLRLRGSGSSGQEITIRHAELMIDGELYTRTLREAAATDRLVLSGGDFDWEPRFAIHGYRYAEVIGWSGNLNEDSVVSRVLHTDMTRTGWFRSSDHLINRLHENVVWSMRSNFVDIPMDCPQRDERLGWTGDIQVFAPTASFLYDVTGMLSSWLEDVAVEQRRRGTVPFYVPYLPLGGWKDAPVDPVAVWGDVAVLTPDVLHARTGDVDVLRRQYPSAVDWVEEVAERAGQSLICDSTMQLGDWLDPSAPPDDPARATTNRALVATAYFAHSARRLAAIATTLARADDAKRYSHLADRVAAAFAERFIRADGSMIDDTQTAYALTTAFELWPTEKMREAGGERLAQLVRQSGGRIATGFAGTPVVSDALTNTGHADEAFELLLARECPSWLYMVEQGATTIWERWDSMLPDGSVNPGGMTSFNHYALGAVADWLHRVVAGLRPGDVAYRTVIFEPHVGGGLTSAGATHLTPYGPVSIDWQIVDAEMIVDIDIPVGVTGEVRLPGFADTVRHGRHRIVRPA